ncbi:MAG: hypothetical protein CM15mP76_05330 [Prochlorococcus sp.]|nr:MAG: hypothetical protein CM15mP76_05330 [Prochlorococcus sp.]
MIWPTMGITPGWDYDYVQAVYTSSITDWGKIGQIFGALITTSLNMMLWQQWAVFVKTRDHLL